jgi:signal transduction histidine kinase
VKIYDKDGTLIVGPGLDQFAACFRDASVDCIQDASVLEAVANLHTLPQWSADTLVVTAPVTSGASLVGAVQLTMSSARINDEIAELTRNRIWQTLALLAVGGGVSFAMASYLLVPVQKLVNATNRLGRGDLESRVDELPGSEMKVLGASFNRMADELQGKIRELEESRLRIVTGQESVRREIATHLHGSVQGSLLAMKVELDALAKEPGIDESHATRIQELAKELDEVTQREIAGVSRRLYPAIIRRGLVPSLQSLFDRFDSSLSLDVQIDERLKQTGGADGDVPESTRLAAYRIADEALTNVVKHAPHCHVDVGVAIDSGCVILTVKDDGPGFDTEKVSAGLGLTSMQDHAGAVGGTCSLTSKPGEGTEVFARLPLQA